MHLRSQSHQEIGQSRCAIIITLASPKVLPTSATQTRTALSQPNAESSANLGVRWLDTTLIPSPTTVATRTHPGLLFGSPIGIVWYNGLIPTGAEVVSYGRERRLCHAAASGGCVMRPRAEVV